MKILRNMYHNDPMGQAAMDYYLLKKNVPIVVKSNKAFKYTIEPAYLFRNFSEMPVNEQIALSHCKGQVLDAGAGSGCHALYLKQKGFDVTALDNSALFCKCMQQQGLVKVLQKDIWELSGYKYDTILLLMNNIGIAGTVYQIPGFLQQLVQNLKPGGQLLLTSSDISYLNPKKSGKTYFGEFIFNMKYKRYKSGKFPWIFIDEPLLENIALDLGLSMQIVNSDKENHNYLAKITKN